MNSEFYTESFTKPGFSRIKGLWGVGGKEKKNHKTHMELLSLLTGQTVLVWALYSSMKGYTESSNKSQLVHLQMNSQNTHEENDSIQFPA